MKIFINSLKIMLVVISSSGFLMAQCPLPEKIIKPSNKAKTGYAPSTQCKSGALKAGDVYEMAIVVQDGVDYKISVAFENSELPTPQFEIYEMVTEKDASGAYKKVKKVIASSEAGEPIEFTTDKARKLVIKVDFTDGTSSKPECVAVLIEDRKTTKIGL